MSVGPIGCLPFACPRFSWKSTASPFLALLGADLHEQRSNSNVGPQRWATSRAGRGHLVVAHDHGRAHAHHLRLRQSQILGRSQVARNNSNHHSVARRSRPNNVRPAFTKSGRSYITPRSTKTLLQPIYVHRRRPPSPRRGLQEPEALARAASCDLSKGVLSSMALPSATKAPQERSLVGEAGSDRSHDECCRGVRRAQPAVRERGPVRSPV